MTAADLAAIREALVRQHTQSVEADTIGPDEARMLRYASEMYVEKTTLMSAHEVVFWEQMVAKLERLAAGGET